MIVRKGIQIKDATKTGTVVAVFATMNVIDKDGDITLPGFFGKQATIMLPAHQWGHVPIGKGVIQEAGEQAVAEMKMNLDIPAAKDWHSAIMFDLAEGGEPLQEYSYGFTIRPGGSSPGGQDASGKEAYRTLRATPDGKPGCIVHEVSPVVVGAGEGTGTLSAKGAKFSDQAESALAAVEDLIARAGSLADLRKKDGRGLSAASVERIKTLRERLKLADSAFAPLLSDDDVRRAVRVELGRFLRNEAGV